MKNHVKGPAYMCQGQRWERPYAVRSTERGRRLRSCKGAGDIHIWAEMTRLDREETFSPITKRVVNIFFFLTITVGQAYSFSNTFSC